MPGVSLRTAAWWSQLMLFLVGSSSASNGRTRGLWQSLTQPITRGRRSRCRLQVAQALVFHWVYMTTSCCSSRWRKSQGIRRWCMIPLRRRGLSGARQSWSPQDLAYAVWPSKHDDALECEGGGSLPSLRMESCLVPLQYSWWGPALVGLMCNLVCLQLLLARCIPNNNLTVMCRFIELP